MIITKGKISIGAYTFPDRKKPMLGIDNGHGEIRCYGSFRSEESADKFMIELAKFVGAEFEEEE